MPFSLELEVLVTGFVILVASFGAQMALKKSGLLPVKYTAENNAFFYTLVLFLVIIFYILNQISSTSGYMSYEYKLASFGAMGASFLTALLFLTYGHKIDIDLDGALAA